MAKVRQDEIQSDSYRKGQLGYAGGIRMVTGKDVAQIGGEWENGVHVGYISNEIIPNHSQIGDSTGGPEEFQRREEDRPTEKQQVEEDNRCEYEVKPLLTQKGPNRTHEKPPFGPTAVSAETLDHSSTSVNSTTGLRSYVFVAVSKKPTTTRELNPSQECTVFHTAGAPGAARASQQSTV